MIIFLFNCLNHPLIAPGYLFLASNSTGLSVLKENHKIQTACGADIELMDPNVLRRTFPWLNVDDIVMGSYGKTGEGFFDPYAFLMAFKNKAKELGVRYCDDEVVGLSANNAKNSIVAVHTEKGESLPVTKVVNSSGCHTQSIYRMLVESCGLHSEAKMFPVEAKRRCIFVFDCQQDPQSKPVGEQSTAVSLSRGCSHTCI
jgi:glycine/D-amino acid oxidase-like deaminating enzyme